MFSDVKKHKLNQMYMIVFAVFIGIQPLLDTIWFYDGTIPQIFGFTIPTLLRIGLVTVLFILALVIYSNKKACIGLVLYLFAVGTFFYLHDKHAKVFTSFSPNNFGYNTFGELFYIVRMLIPWLVVFMFVLSGVTKKEFEFITMLVSAVMSLSIVITNILKISLGSYTNHRIHGNIFEWFIYPGGFTSNELASKGFMYFSISSTVMLLTYPYLLYMFMSNKKKIHALLAVIEAFALLMVGTKVTAYGVVGMTIIMFAAYLFCGVIKRDYKVNVVIAILMLILIGMLGITYTYSPAKIKMSFDKKYARETDKAEKKKSKHKTLAMKRNPESIIEYIDKNIKYLSVKEEFIKTSYDYKKDPYFWYDFLNEYYPSQRMQNRIVEKLMLERVKEVNNNKTDDILGIGYTRTSNIYNLERDFMYQYYSLGYLGAFLIVGPYIVLIIASIAIMLIRFKKKATLRNGAILLGLGFTCCSAYFSGNTLETLGVSIVMAWFCGEIISRVIFSKEQN